MIRPSLPLPGLALIAVTVMVGCVGLIVTELSGQWGWAFAGGFLLLIGFSALAALLIAWVRSTVRVTTDTDGVTATSGKTSISATWHEISAVTTTGDELRIRRRQAQGLVVKLPRRIRPATLDALTADLVAHLDQAQPPPVAQPTQPAVDPAVEG